MNIKTDVLREIIAECHEDYVGLWLIARKVKDAGRADEPSTMSVVLTLVTALLAHEGITAGQFKDFQFEVWKETPNVIVERIKREWVELGRTPSLGDIVWFAAAERTLTNGR